MLYSQLHLLLVVEKGETQFELSHVDLDRPRRIKCCEKRERDRQKETDRE